MVPRFGCTKEEEDKRSMRMRTILCSLFVNRGLQVNPD